MPHPIPAPCPGRCNAAWRKAEQQLEAQGTEHHLTPQWGKPVHCLGCTDRARVQLAELPELVAAIWLEALNGTPTKTTGTIGRVSTPVWPGQAARLLTDHIVGSMLDLEDDIRNLRQLNTRRAGRREGADVTAAARFLTAHLPWALEYHPLAGELFDRLSGNPASQISEWHRAAERFTSRDRRLEHRRVPCPRCELLTLFRADGDDYIECRNAICGLLLTQAEFDEHARSLAAGCAGKAAA